MNTYEKQQGMLMSMLKMTKEPVAVKLVYSDEEFRSYEANELVRPLRYCVAVKSAGLGNAIKFRKENSGCIGSTKALGFEPETEAFYKGEEGCQLGLFEDPAIAASTAAQMKMLDKPLYGVIVKPLGSFRENEEQPDVVIAVGTAREMMRLLQGYCCSFGIQPRMNPTGNQAVCSECTAYPILTGDMNLSLFCSGTRFNAKWDDTEMSAGIPYEKFEGLLDGIRKTINGTEMDQRKQEIIEALNAMGDSAEDITMGTAYYLSV